MYGILYMRLSQKILEIKYQSLGKDFDFLYIFFNLILNGHNPSIHHLITQLRKVILLAWTWGWGGNIK